MPNIEDFKTSAFRTESKHVFYTTDIKFENKIRYYKHHKYLLEDYTGLI